MIRGKFLGGQKNMEVRSQESGVRMNSRGRISNNQHGISNVQGEQSGA